MEPLKYIKTETLDKGRVKTSLHLLLVDEGIFVTYVTGFARGEISHIEMRGGSTIKCPTDKYDRKIALIEAAKRLKKERYAIESIDTGRDMDGNIVTDIHLERSSPIHKITLRNNKVRIWPRR